MGTIGVGLEAHRVGIASEVARGLSFLTLQRGDAFRDALRNKPQCRRQAGRRMTEV
ncbi:DUF1534 domain-containing protein [Pseudomonas tremae]|nr:DUF1534 domain-containing protein [Pseudomonas tremae]